MTIPLFSWPAETEEVHITLPYNPITGSLSIHAPQGTSIRAVARGTIAAISSTHLQLIAEPFLITYDGLQNISVKPGANVESGDVIAQSGSPKSITLLIRQTIDPTSLLDTTPPVKPQRRIKAKPQPAPATPGPEDGKVYVKATTEAVRVREQPVDGKPVGQLKLDEPVESLESPAETQAKIGVQGQWLKIRRWDGLVGYVAAWFVQMTDPPQFKITGSLTGMNLDIYHPLGAPDPQQMSGIGWARLKFNVSLNPDYPQGDPRRYGNTDIEAAYKRYLPYVEKYHKAGMKILMVFTHQLYGEGAGFNWGQMDGGKWGQLTTRYSDFARQVAQKFAGTGMINVYQVWNEQDTKEGRAAVAVPPSEYGKMLTETIHAIRSADPKPFIITGGHTSGPDAGSQYASQTLAAMPADVRPDGIAFHPYGRGKAGHKFSNWGPLEEEVRKYAGVMPGKPLWITEWGVLDHQGRGDAIPDVTDYASSFMDLCKQDFTGKIAAAMWYAWADSMDNGFGLVDHSGRVKTLLYEKFCTLG